MTGFGRSVVETDERRATVEVKTVNHRQLDVQVKLPRQLNFLEPELRRAAVGYMRRGHVETCVAYADLRRDRVEPEIDLALAEKYMGFAKELEKLGLANDLTATAALRLPDVVRTTGAPDDEDAIREIATRAMREACEMAVESREREGAKLKQDLALRLRNLEKLVGEIEARAPKIVAEREERLRERIKERLADAEFDEARLLAEVAIFADKASVDEEIARLKAHVSNGLALTESEGETGRKLDFLAQEINRELNTVAAKSNDLELTRKTLEAKNELEKFREQAQNVE